MSAFPVSCNNCLSGKRQFYAYLECKHFLCLSCCLCLANFQNLTIRCCYRNTQMSQQLASIMFQEIRKRNNLRTLQLQGNDVNITKQNKYLNKLQNTTDDWNTNTNKEQRWQRETKLQKSQCFNKAPAFGKVQQQVRQTRSNWKQFKQQETSTQVNTEQKRNQIQSNLKSEPEVMQFECPTFKEIKKQVLPIQKQKQQKYTSNYLCWKNNQSINDRIISKLNYHKQKMNNLIKQHHY